MRFKRNVPVPKDDWHSWFAWRPVPLLGRCQYAWLERVERKGRYHPSTMTGSTAPRIRPARWSFIYRPVLL
jgi:hypothetical protein